MFLLEMLSSPFMQRAVAAGAMLALLLSGLGIFVTLRKMAFFGDGIAHSSLAGIAIAVLAGASPMPVALVWAVGVALFIYWLERRTKLSSDTLIGIFFTASMALGVVLMSLTRGYQPELVSYLFGNILSVRPDDLLIISIASAAILTWLGLSFREIAYLSLAEEPATVAGVPVRTHTILLYVALAVATVLSVKILGIILVSALLILPSATARALTASLRGYAAASLAVALIVVLLGLAVSFRFDLPPGATIVLVGAALFFVATAGSAAARRRA